MEGMAGRLAARRAADGRRQASSGGPLGAEALQAGKGGEIAFAVAPMAAHSRRCPKSCQGDPLHGPDRPSCPPPQPPPASFTVLEEGTSVLRAPVKMVFVRTGEEGAGGASREHGGALPRCRAFGRPRTPARAPGSLACRRNADARPLPAPQTARMCWTSRPRPPWPM